jgi:F-type H+/Na+-transporting ATPase subunit beta
MAEQNGSNVGRIEEIQSVVIECVFPEKLPEIYNAIEIDMPGRDGGASSRLVAEV